MEKLPPAVFLSLDISAQKRNCCCCFCRLLCWHFYDCIWCACADATAWTIWIQTQQDNYCSSRVIGMMLSLICFNDKCWLNSEHIHTVCVCVRAMERIVPENMRTKPWNLSTEIHRIFLAATMFSNERKKTGTLTFIEKKVHLFRKSKTNKWTHSLYACLCLCVYAFFSTGFTLMSEIFKNGQCQRR